jgi:uncharacterized protein (DUF433 family)
VAEVREGRTYYGRVWTEGDYDDYVRPSIINLGVGEGGIGILTIISRLRTNNNDVDEVVAAFAPYLTRDDVLAAVRYYEKEAPDREELDARIQDQQAANGA